MAIKKIKREEIDFNKIYGTKYDAQNNQNNVKTNEVYWGDNGDLYVDFDDSTNTGVVKENGVALGYINKDSLKNNNNSNKSSMYNGSYRDDSDVMKKQTTISKISQNSMYNGSYRDDSDIMKKKGGVVANNVSHQEENEIYDDLNILYSPETEKFENQSINPIFIQDPDDNLENHEEIAPIEQPDVPNEDFSSDYEEEIEPIEQEYNSQLGIDTSLDIKDQLIGGQAIEIPKSIPQTGIIKNYTNYDYYYGSWNPGTAQRELSEQWAAAGKPNDRGIATMNDRYLVAVSSKFGKVGDNIDVCLDNGVVIPCIIGDAKGADAQSEWGHTFGGAVDVIEWESMGGKEIINTDGWQGHKVEQIINRDR